MLAHCFDSCWIYDTRKHHLQEDIVINRDIDQHLQPDLEKGESVTDKRATNLNLVSEETKFAPLEHTTAMIGDEKIVGSPVEESEIEQEGLTLVNQFRIAG